MRVLVLGASGTVGNAAASALESRDHEVIRASRSGDPSVDVLDTDSLRALFEAMEPVDAVVCAVGSVPFKPLAELSADDFVAAYRGKVASQVGVVQVGTPHVRDGGSFTLTTGVLAREPILTGTAASMANGAVEAFVMAAAVELPRGLRINAVSPTVLVEATAYHPSFPGFTQVSAAAVGQGFVKSVEGVQTGQVYVLDGQ